MSTLNEVQFVAEVKSWVDEICRSEGASFPFAKAEIEVRSKGKRERRDFVLLNHRGEKVLTGEVKLPDRSDGRNPYAEELVLDAQEKANAVGVDYFFTWNVNRMVLWKTFVAGLPVADRSIDFFDWASVRDSDELSRPEVVSLLKGKWVEFLSYFADIHRGKRAIPRYPLDKKFVHYLESALEGPANLTRTALYQITDHDKRFTEKIRKWVSSNLGGEFGADQRDELLDTAARFSCYVLAIKLVFYAALRRRHDQLPPLRIPQNGLTAPELDGRLTKAFERAQKVSGDYETVFEGDGFGEKLPLLVDEVVPEWRSLIRQVDLYDFDKIDFHLIGQIFERLISPAERRRNGQHYTKSEIVDLINCFCIQKPEDVVIDPACGGGTFLVRAYARKQWLEERAQSKRTHEERLAEIFGVDISTYAAHLSVVSLATRDMGRVANYPRVSCKDFFDVKRGAKLFPARVTKVKGKSEIVKVALERVDAVVGNPPYVRQEVLTSDQKKDYANTFRKSWPDLKLSGRSDLHIYFWPHASSFLPETDSHFGFLTSASWLDVEYGFPLQRWILQHFCIEAIMESSVEPWFTDARVATAVTVLRREPDLKKRQTNLVRFVQFRRPLEDILMDVEHGADPIAASEELRRRILATKKNVETKDWRIRVVSQRDLIESSDKSNPGTHSGGKWGIHLRAPDIYFELMDRFGDKFVPLSEIAEIRRGITSGCDAFFFPRDVTDEVVEKLSEAELKKRYGITKKDTKRIRICKAGDGSVHLIEAEYLEPEVHSLMEIDSITIDTLALSRVAFIVNDSKSKLRDTRALKYIRWGEKQKFHLRDTCAARETEARNWYQIEPETRSFGILPKIQQYRHIVPLNENGLLVNCSLLELCSAKTDNHVLVAVLNSSIVGLFKWSYGRGLGREANLQLDVYSAQMMPIPDASKFTSDSLEKIAAAFEKMRKSRRVNLADEITWEERRVLDSAILLAVGVPPAEMTRLQEGLYGAIVALHSEMRDLELKAQKNRLKSARNGESPADAASSDEWKISDDSESDDQ